MQSRIYNFADLLTQTNFKRLWLGHLEPGVYSGFSAAVTDVTFDGYTFGVTASSTVDGNLLLCNTGVWVYEDTPVTLSLASYIGLLPQKKTLICSHVDADFAGGNVATYTIVDGFVSQDDVQGAILGWWDYPGLAVAVDLTQFTANSVTATPSLMSAPKDWHQTLDANATVEILWSSTRQCSYLRITQSALAGGTSTFRWPWLSADSVGPSDIVQYIEGSYLTHTVTYYDTAAVAGTPVVTSGPSTSGLTITALNDKALTGTWESGACWSIQLDISMGVSTVVDVYPMVVNYSSKKA